MTSPFGLDPDGLRCPYPAYEELRARGRVVEVDGLGAFAVTGMDDIQAVLRQPAVASSRLPTGPAATSQLREAVLRLQAQGRLPKAAAEHLARTPDRTLFTIDPPGHTRQRRQMGRLFAPIQVMAWEPMARELVSAIVAELPAGRPVDLVHDLAVKVPVQVMSRLLRLAPSEFATVKRWSGEVTAAIGNPAADDVALAQVLVSRREMELVFSRLLNEARLDPGDDLVTAVAMAGGPAEGDDAGPLDGDAEGPAAHDWLSESERCGLLINFLVAGNESTAKLIAACLRVLGDDPALFAELRSRPALVVPLIEEVLRLEPPTQGMFRHLEGNLDVGGEVLPEGSHVFLVYAAGNRDPAAFSEPDELRLDRPNGNRHLSFGHGIHLCLGAGLARMEARVTLEVVLDQLASITLTPDNTFDHEPTYLLHGLRALHAVLERPAGLVADPIAR